MLLKKLSAEDASTINKWLEDPAIYYYMKPESINPNLQMLSYGIQSEGLIGWACLFNIDMENQKAEYGIAVPNHQPRTCYRATIEMLGIGFGIGLNRIYIRPLKSNLRDRDQRERFGFVREGVERQAVRRGDIFEDVVVMSILKTEFERKWGKCQQSRT